jgi:peptidoglycan/xylan/chitin deacetylase (PgdA/CDA1 family)
MARRDVLVLCYHGVHPEALHGEVTPDALRAQLSLVARRGYRWSTFTEAVLGDERARVAAVTFDDGIASAVEHGLPVLDELGAPGTMFLTVTMLGRGGMLDEPAALRLADRGWEIGSHTMTHPVLTNVDDAMLVTELVESKQALEVLTGRPCTAVSYPTGRCNARVVEAAGAAGYVAGAALEGAAEVPPSALAWPRVGIRGDDSLSVFSVKTSSAVRKIRSSRVRRPVASLATAMGRSRRLLRRSA